MYPEETMAQAAGGVRRADAMTIAAERLEGVSALLMAAQRHWNEPDRDTRLAVALEASREVWRDIQAALAESTLSLPIEVQQNMLILSVYADGRLDECETTPSSDKLAPLVSLTRNLASSLKEWREAA
jgi:flagellar biosynthesis regulator FlaF